MGEHGGVATCRVCGTTFHWAVKAKKGQVALQPRICGTLYCRAIEEWGDEEWGGHARMSEARRIVGLELDELDQESLRRFPNPPRIPCSSQT